VGGNNPAKYATRRNRPERHNSRAGSGQNIMKLCDYVPASESDLFRSVRLEPRLILFLVRETGGLSATAEAVAVAFATDFSKFPVLANDDESDLDMVRREPMIIGNTAVNLIRLLDKNPPPPPPQFPGPVPPPAGGSIIGSSSKSHIPSAQQFSIVFTAKAATQVRTHVTSHFKRKTISFVVVIVVVVVVTSGGSRRRGRPVLTVVPLYCIRVQCSACACILYVLRTREKKTEKIYTQKYRTVGGRYHTLCRRTWPFNYLVYTACCGW